MDIITLPNATIHCAAIPVVTLSSVDHGRLSRGYYLATENGYIITTQALEPLIAND